MILLSQHQVFRDKQPVFMRKVYLSISLLELFMFKIALFLTFRRVAKFSEIEPVLFQKDDDDDDDINDNT